MTQSDGLLKKTGKRLDLRLETEGETEGRRELEKRKPREKQKGGEEQKRKAQHCCSNSGPILSSPKTHMSPVGRLVRTTS